MNFLKRNKIERVMNAVAAGTSDQNSSVIDMVGYQEVTFVALFGTLTATQVTQIKVQQGDQANLSDAADLLGTNVGPLADGDSNKMLAVGVYRPTKRYVRCVVDRGTANAVIDGVLAILTEGPNVPVTQGATLISFENHFSPAEGTA